MATIAYPGSGGNGPVTKTRADKFVPEIWSDEIIAAYEKKLVTANLVDQMPMTGKKGDRIHIPSPTRGDASAKAAATAVTLIYNTESEVLVDIDQHWEYSRLVEDIVTKQALDTLRRFYTSDAGYALAKRVDTEILEGMEAYQAGTVAAGTYATGVIGGDGATLYTSGANNATALTDVGLRRAIQTLDDADVPMDGRYLVIPPVTANTIRGIARFTEQAFIGSGDAIKTGEIANLYGVRVFVSTNVVAATGGARACPLFQRESFVLAKQMNPRVQTQYKQEYLADLLTADVLFGVKALRSEGGIHLLVPAS